MIKVAVGNKAIVASRETGDSWRSALRSGCAGHHAGYEWERPPHQLQIWWGRPSLPV